MESNETQNLQQSQSQEPQAESGFWGAAWLFFWDFLKIFVIALAIIIPVRFYLFQPFIVNGHSMQPNFYDGEYLIIDEISYRLQDPDRGQVAVIHSPEDDTQYFIKRIIGLPGETVEIERGSVHIYNEENPSGFVLVEDYLNENINTFGTMRVTLSADQYFVLGDNRPASSDSRVFGPISKELFVGKVFIRAFPLKRFSVFSSPQYSY